MSGEKINIAGKSPVIDTEYRYKMHPLVVKTESGTTVLVNIVEVAKELNRSALEISKFFGIELGSQTTFDEKTGRYTVNGGRIASDLQTRLKVYVEKFVLCGGCKKPETRYEFKRDIIYQKCDACRHKEAVDMNHRLAKYILAQNTSKDKHERKERKRESNKEPQKQVKGSKKEGDMDGKSVGQSFEYGLIKEAVQKEKVKTTIKKEKKTSAKGTSNPGIDMSGKEEETDSEIQDRLAAVEDAIVRFRQWCSVHTTATTCTATRETSAEQLWFLQIAASISTCYRAVIFIGAVFTEAVFADEQVKVYKEDLQLLADTMIKQRQMIAAFEWFCGSRFPGLQSRFVVLLKQLYDEDIVDEESLLIWRQDTTRNQYSLDEMVTLDTLERLKESSLPLFTWLENAQCSDEDDESVECDSGDEDAVGDRDAANNEHVREDDVQGDSCEV